MLTTDIKMKGVSVEMIDAVQRFENTNALFMEKNIDSLIHVQKTWWKKRPLDFSNLM